MKRTSRPFLLLAAPVLLLLVCGCGKLRRAKSDASASQAPAAAFTRANYMRLEPGLSEPEVVAMFGPPQETWTEWKDSKKSVWINGSQKVTVTFQGDQLIASSYPGEAEERRRQRAAHQAAAVLMTPLREYVLKNHNRFPARLEELDLTPLKGHPDTMAVLKRGDIVIPWGKSANRLVWAHWKEAPEYGGWYVRFDDNSFERVTPAEFAKLNAILLTADTIPADIVAKSAPEPGKPDPFAAAERSDRGTQGFFTSAEMLPLLKSKPANLDEVAAHMVRSHNNVVMLRRLEKGELIVRWGRDPKQGVYAYPRGFPKAGSWAIYNGQWAAFARLEDAQKAFDE
ncbi:hypothetical protein [Zavarzinella formosa]|uniref:hypothetical protein n=1 Tax=Zavarzinella formosa TaxID=360055 RepID=UPI00035DB6A7|nr:hypothetical protein [Zavarzinella formosa]